jgi:hypothetical protein
MTLAVIANGRSLERSGIAFGAAEKLAELLKLSFRGIGQPFETG